MTFKNSVLNDSPEKIICFYMNDSRKIQIIRTLPKANWERVVFPRQRLLFEALTSDKLEIQICKVISLLIPCHKLRVDEKFTRCLSTSLSKDN
jgi:hypothetical protein